MTRLLRLLVVAPHAVLGGQESWLLQLLDATARLDVRVLLLQDGPLRGELERRGIPVELLPVGTRPVDLVSPVLSLARRLRWDRPDVVLANGVKAQFVAGPAARLAGVPVVFARHDHAFASAVPALARLADAIVGTTPQVLQGLDHLSPVVVLPPLPVLSAAPRAEARATLSSYGVSFRSGRLYLVMATRLMPYKGVDDAVVALAQREAQNWDLIVLGTDDPAEPREAVRLAALAAGRGVADRVQLVGHVPGAAALLGAFDALAVLTKPGRPRDPGREGFGMTVLEAMVAGVPVVAVGGGDIEERLSGRAGRVVPVGDPAAVAAALSSLTADARAACSSAGKALVSDHPTAGQSAAVLCGVLAAAARRPGAGLDTRRAVSVVVPVYNEGAEVDEVVRQLLPQLVEEDELVVVDDASTDDTRVRLTTWSARSTQVRAVRMPQNGGPSAARNAGVAAARFARIICTDAGNELPFDWLEAMRSALDDQPATDLVTGAYRVSGRGSIERAMEVALYPGVEETLHRGPLLRVYGRVFGRRFDPDRPAGRSVAFTREAWDRVGGFPERLATGEDVAFGLAVARSGGRCVLQTDSPVVWHQHATLRATARMYYRYGRGDGLLGERIVVGRNAARAGAALLVPLALLTGQRGARAMVVAAGGAYLSMPLARLAREGGPPRAALAVPLVLVLKDLSKAGGCLAGLYLAVAHRDCS